MINRESTNFLDNYSNVSSIKQHTINTQKYINDNNNEIVKSINTLAITQELSKNFTPENKIPKYRSKSSKIKNDNNRPFENGREKLTATELPLENDKNQLLNYSIIEIKPEIESETNKDSEDLIDLTIFELLDKNSKQFVLKPATMGLTLKCQIFRQKGIFSQYKFYLENLEGQLLLIMTARKRKKTKTASYIINYISYDESNVEKYIETPIAKLKSNFIGIFCFYIRKN